MLPSRVSGTNVEVVSGATQLKLRTSQAISQFLGSGCSTAIMSDNSQRALASVLHTSEHP
eukprot:7965050-Alexandrium_andersonii.AAC.1